MKQLMRKATIRGTGVRKRCRVSERIYIKGIGINDEAALEELKWNMKETLDRYREFNLDRTIIISDIWKEDKVSYKGEAYTIYSEEIEFGQKLPNQRDLSTSELF